MILNSHHGMGSTLSTTSSQIGSALIAGSAATGPAAPFVAAAGAAAELVGAVANLFSGCGATCTLATSIVNQVEPYLQTNMENYFTNANRTTADQQVALSTFDQMWSIVESKCGQPNLGSAGSACINDRGPNGCLAKTTANEYPMYSSVPYPVGECWNWFVGYRDPIANDVPPGGSGTVTSSVSSALSSIESSDYAPLIAIAAIVALVALL
jgi:hypothetical protein